MHASFWKIFESPIFWSALCAWLMAQFTKMLCSYIQTRRLDFSYLVSTGGMPSAHSAMACGLSAAFGITEGFDSPIFAMSLAWAIIVFFDAATVRRAAGQQARLLNQLVDQFFKEHHVSEKKLAELLGHTRLEVGMGMIMGILVAMIVTSFRWIMHG